MTLFDNAIKNMGLLNGGTMVLLNGRWWSEVKKLRGSTSRSFLATLRELWSNWGLFLWRGKW